jgi:hypothetical protein
VPVAGAGAVLLAVVDVLALGAAGAAAGGWVRFACSVAAALACASDAALVDVVVVLAVVVDAVAAVLSAAAWPWASTRPTLVPRSAFSSASDFTSVSYESTGVFEAAAIYIA